MIADWHPAAEDALLRLRTPDAGWGYRPDSPAYVEPTGLACLALVASETQRKEARFREAIEESADWLAGVQGADGSLGISATQPKPGWPTPYAILLWSELQVHAAHLDRAVRWLLGRHGHAYKKPADSPIGHDTTIPGWPWVDETHSWLEPTALAVLALACAGETNHGRTRDGIRLIRDRAVRTGGWNYGNNAVFGRDLRSRPAPTGLALAALAVEGERDDCVERGLRYLSDFLPQTRSPQSLCWGLLGMKAWGVWPEEAGQWLAEAFENTMRRRDPAPQLAYLVLAAGRRSLEVLGLGTGGGR